MPPEQKEVAFLEKIKQSFYIIMNSRISLCTRCFYLPLLGFFYYYYYYYVPLAPFTSDCYCNSMQNEDIKLQLK